MMNKKTNYNEQFKTVVLGFTDQVYRLNRQLEKLKGTVQKIDKRSDVLVETISRRIQLKELLKEINELQEKAKEEEQFYYGFFCKIVRTRRETNKKASIPQNRTNILDFVLKIINSCKRQLV